MNPSDPVLFHQLRAIQKIIQDETWLEGERRGCHVRSDDRVVREKVCEIILRIGQHLRETFSATAQDRPCNAAAASMTSLTVARHEEAA